MLLTLRQILRGLGRNRRSMADYVDNKRPKGEKGYVNNRHTPTDADVEKIAGFDANVLVEEDGVHRMENRSTNW